MEANNPGEERVGEMHRRDTKMADGRYLIYYTFGDEAETTEPTDQPSDTEEEKNV